MRLIAVLTLSLALAGCANVVDGTAAPGEKPTTTAPAPTTTAPAMVTTASLSTLLLKRGELGTIVGDTDMNQVEEITTANPEAMASLEPYKCRARTLTAEVGMGVRTVQGVLGNGNRGAGGQSATQVVAVFDNRADPGQYLALALDEWDNCPRGEVFTIDPGSGDALKYEAGEVLPGKTRIGNTITRLDPPPRTCHKVMAAQANVLVETTVCGTGDTAGQANEIADVILAKVPR